MQTVANVLSPEEKTLVENITALVNQLNAMQETGMDNETPEVENAEDPKKLMEAALSENGEEDAVDVKKATTETGDTKAEQRIDEQTETTDQAMTQLKKSVDALTATLSNFGAVKKTKAPQADFLKGIEKSLVAILENQKAQGEINKELFGAMGITEEMIQKSLPQKQDNAKPIQNIGNANMIKDIVVEAMTQINKNQTNAAYQHPFNQKREIHKNCEDIVKHVHSAANRR